MIPIQITGTIMMGVAAADTDVSKWVTKMIIHRQRVSIVVPATLGNRETSEAAGAVSTVVELEFFSDFTAGSIWALLAAAMDTGRSELLFSGLFEPGPVSDANPRWAGTMVVLGVDTGGAIGNLRSQAQTFPVKAGTLTRSIS